MSFKPTDEQLEIVKSVRTDDHVTISAGAGSGKTTSLKMISDSKGPNQRGHYMAFNRAIAQEAAASFPPNTACSTVHSLAFREVGAQYADRLDQPYPKTQKMTSALGVTRKNYVVTTTWGEEIELRGKQLARLAVDTVDRFCLSADDELTEKHVPRIPMIDEEDSWEHNNAMARVIVPLARQVWDDLQDPDGGIFKVQHNLYLKRWQLTKPNMGVDFLLVDECQPPDTLVSMSEKSGGGYKKIADLEIGDSVVSFRKGRKTCNKVIGNKILGKTIKHYSGPMIVAETDVGTSRYTPNHICMAKIGKAFQDKFMLYVMNQGQNFRIGVAQCWHGKRSQNNFGAIGRLREERGDSLWILDVFDTRQEANVWEQYYSCKYGVPQVTFTGSKASHFWPMWNPEFCDENGLLSEFGRDIRYPLVTKERRYMLADRFTEIRASNLMDGFLMRDQELEFHSVKITTEDYEGDVVSLSVAGLETYVADNMITHNFQDLNPLMYDIAMTQADNETQLVLVGDRSQRIFSWNGAMNAMDMIEGSQKCALTRSFRFGPEIAEQANRILDILGEPHLTGAGPEGRVDYLDNPHAILCRTNALAVTTAIDRIQKGMKVCLAGGTKDIEFFAQGAEALQKWGSSNHPKLLHFTSWDQVHTFVEEGTRESNEIAGLVRLVDTLGIERIKRELSKCTTERNADVLISTAHKAKGREWQSVQIAHDFPDADEINNPEEYRLAYVGITRAQSALDIRGLRWL